MKRSGKRLLAAFLCLAMALTLLPMSALAKWDEEELPTVPVSEDSGAAVKAELPAEAPDGGDKAELDAGSIPTDGAVADTWVQIAASKATGSVDPVVQDGKIVLSAVTGNGNNLDNSNPAIFVDTDMNKALSKLEGSVEKTLSFTLTPSSSGSWMGFALMLNYNGEVQGNASAYHIGYPSGDTTGWFVQNYGATSVSWPGFTGPDMIANTPANFEIKWSDAGVSSFRINGETIALPSSATLNTVPAISGDNVNGLKGVAFKVGTKTDATTLRLSNVHYTGQKTISTYDVTGTVKDTESKAALAGVTVTVTPGNYTATTGTNGGYTLELPDGTYELNFKKDGYASATKGVTVSGGNLSGQDVLLAVTHTVEIPTDGVNDTWVQVEATKKGADSVAPAVVDGKLVLQSAPSNLFNFASGTPAIFTNATMDAALAATSGEKFLTFTVTPECVKEANDAIPDYIAFAINIDYNGGVNSTAQAYHIGFYNADTDATKGTCFVQYYGGTGQYPSIPNISMPRGGEPLKFEIRWTDQQVTLKINGVDCTVNNGDRGGVPVTNRVAISLAGKNFSDDTLQNKSRATKLTFSDIHYSGQATEAGHKVAGTVVDDSGRKLEGVTVSAGNGKYEATTDANGQYNMVLREEITPYTVKAELDGYVSAEKSVEVNASSDYQVLENTNLTLKLLPVISGKVVDSKGKPVRASVKSDKREKSTVADENGNFTVIGAVDGEHTLSLTAEGYEPKEVKVTVAGQNVKLDDIVMEDRKIPAYTLVTEDMEVQVAQNFPQVIEYKMLNIKDAEGNPATMYGQTAELNTLKINGVAVVPTVTSVFDEATGKKVTYSMVIDESNNNGTGVTATITAELRVGLTDINDKNSAAAGRTLGFYITNVEYAGDDPAATRLAYPVDMIEIPNHSLVSVRSTEPGAAVTGGRQAANTTVTGDSTYVAAENLSKRNYEDYFAAMIYNNTLSASLASNSAYAARGSAGDQCYPVRAQFEAKDGGETVSIGLGSTLWYYDHDITVDQHGDDQVLTEDQLSRAERIIAPLEEPYAKVVIADDMNGNGKVDWQDGAIAYRETVMHIPVNGQQVANTANLRISMNFGSMAANPFLIALDNVKRVSAHTDGLGQFVLLKGYAGEGHDSNHPDYGNIGIRMGGAEDMVTLMREGEKLGAAFGIHTNASEFYAEAIDENNQVRRNRDGSMHYGWNWLDQGIAINGVYDYAKGLQLQRWNELYEQIKGYPFTVYVDVWGNNTSGTENGFMTRALTKNIVGNGHDKWRIAHEWAWANPYDSTFQHWTTDFTYGDYSQKGKLSGSVIRFILNQYKDSFPPDFASYGGASNAPLLGGPAMQGFEGWQGDGEYNLSIYNTYNQMVYTKFLQHYPVVEWTYSDEPVVIPYNGGSAGHSRSNDTTSEWLPEAQVRLSDGKDEIVVTRGTSGKLVTDFGMDTVDKFLANETEYRSRVVTLNGKVIVTGAPASAGEDNTFPASKATLKYLIPWYWKVDGEKVDAADEKLYHWNAQGGQSTWTLPDGWENLATVTLYELSDQGRDAGKTVKVIDGKVTLSNIKKNTGYVVTKGADKGAGPVIEYGTGLYLKDPSFNMDTSRADCPWTVSGKGSAIHTTNSEGIGVLKMTGNVSVSQIMTDLEAGKNYVSYVAVDNRSDAKASMTITDQDGNVVATNYTMKSIAKNYVSSYYLHNGHGVEAGGSYFQNMFVYFTPEVGKTYTMTLAREGTSSGNVYFDDLRTVEYGLNDYKANEDNKGKVESPVTYDPDTGAVTALTQDFENVPQGIWPFVVGPVESVADNRSHLSELNAPYTQAGWDVKKMDDVIDGQWSVKANGLHGRNNLVYQTIPQNFRFEADKVYTVSFDYELGSAGSYVAVVGDGAYTGLDGLTVYNLEQTLNTTVPTTPNVTGKVNKADVGHIEFTVVGSESGQTWVGIYSKDNADNQGTSGSASAFGGYLDFVLDNLSIQLAPPEKNELALLLQEADTMLEANYNEKVNGAWSSFETARTNGHTVFDNESASETDVVNAVNALKNAIANLEKVNISISGTVMNANNKPVAGVELTLEDENYMPVGLTLTTGEDGTFEFVSKSGVELVPAIYHVKAQGTGYNVATTGDILVTKDDAAKTADITLDAEAPGAYVNDFNGGDISMMGHLDPPEGTEVDESQWPELEWVEYNGSGALKVTFRGNGNAGGLLDCRNISNVVDKTLAFVNGTVSYDVTPLTSGVRFGVTLRAGEKMNDRVCIGQQDRVGQWMGEFWKNTEGSDWTVTTTGKISVDSGATRNVRVVAEDQNFQVFIDGDKVYDVTMNNVQTTAGWAGINMRYNSGSEFIIDNIRISTDETADGTHNVSGTVKARSGADISGAAIDLLDKDGNRLDGTSTNALSQYQIKGVAPGTYTLKVSAPFFQEQTKSITVGSSDLENQNFTLAPDISSLTELIAQVEALKEEDYTAETWMNLAEPLAEAKAINGESSIAALNTAYRNLSNAKDALVASEKAAADFSELRDLHKEMANKENENYTNTTWDAFQAALEDARQVLLAGTADQKTVDDTKVALQAAFDALIQADDPATMDYSALQAAYDKAKDVEQGKYTDASWTTFVEAREAALAILSNADGLTQAEVDAAAKALIDAQSGLRTSGGSGGGTVAPTTPSTSTETREDGAKVTTETKPNGDKVETVEQTDGTKSETVTTPAGDKTITVTDAEGEEIAKVEIPAVIPEPETKFEDIFTTPWAETSINNVAGLGLVNGVGGNKYAPGTPMTRGSLATVLHRFSQGKVDYETTFKDVADDEYYTEGVTWAAKVHVVTGYTTEIFAPNDIITREQLAVMMTRYAKLIGMDTTADASKLNSFSDGDTTGSWAVNGVAWCVEHGILKGKGGNVLDPTTQVTRAEVAVMLDRFIELIQK